MKLKLPRVLLFSPLCACGLLDSTDGKAGWIVVGFYIIFGGVKGEGRGVQAMFGTKRVNKVRKSRHKCGACHRFCGWRRR